MSEPRNAEINIGDPQVWVDLYVEQSRLDDDLVVATEIGKRAMESVESMTIGMQLEMSLTEDSNNPDGLLALGDEAVSTGEQFRAVQRNALEAYEKVTAIYGQVGFREWELGSELESTPPAAYVTRAIGEPSVPLDKRYKQVRAEIEVFRQLTGEVRPDVTLGPGLETAWSKNRLSNFVLNIQRLQMAQLLLSEDPFATATSFSKEHILEQLGQPPEVIPEDLEVMLANNPEAASWFQAAVKICAEIEPIEQGLTIDQVQTQQPS